MKVAERSIKRKVFTHKDGKVVRSLVELVILPDLFGEKPAGYIHKVFTDLGWRDKGLATKLVKDAVKYAKEYGCYKVFLVCSVERASSGFYQRSGFEVNGTEMVLRFD